MKRSPVSKQKAHECMHSNCFSSFFKTVNIFVGAEQDTVTIYAVSFILVLIKPCTCNIIDTPQERGWGRGWELSERGGVS